MWNGAHAYSSQANALKLSYQLKKKQHQLYMKVNFSTNPSIKRRKIFIKIDTIKTIFSNQFASILKPILIILSTKIGGQQKGRNIKDSLI